jgi:hypothetical protein
MSDRLKLLRTVTADLIFLAFVLAGLAVFLEIAARALQRNSRPLIPAVLDGFGGHRLEKELDLTVKLPHYERMQLTTDATGARIADVAARSANRSDGILFVGDSQVLGWGLSFSETAAARLAQRMHVPLERVTILAAALQDPERELSWARDYTRAHPQRQRIEVVALDLGSDLDEMYMGRAPDHLPSGSVTSWLSRHSVAFLDFDMLRLALGHRQKDQHVEVNYSMLLLDDTERAILAEGVTASLDRLVRALPPADERAVLIIPQDSQVAASQFLKYRSVYRTESDFALHQAAQREAVQHLETFQADIVARLKSRLNIPVIVLEPPLRAALNQPSLIDVTSHHLMAAGQEVAAQALAAGMEVKP